MMMTTSVLRMVLVAALVVGSIVNDAFATELPPVHLRCEKDADCVLIGTGGCCGADFAVKKGYEKKFAKPPDESCKYKDMACPMFVVPTCSPPGICGAKDDVAICGRLRAEQRACEKDTDCDAVLVTCHGWFGANRKSRKDVVAYDACMAKHAGNRCPALSAPRPRAGCRDGFCSVH